MVHENSGRFRSASRGKEGIIYVPADLEKGIMYSKIGLDLVRELVEKIQGILSI